ncbi:MAG TPA: YggS family pyridoxal phosphate-dependent enzyme [Flavobacteriales bacterium]|jgi:PLP dependent protein|nr:YggS family pyridoxal phosphate-dependent enzyme [Flavobacteriales bacterium]
MSVAENLKRIKDSLPDNVTLVAVSKTHTIEHIMKAYEEGQRDFGENKVQELTAKAEVMPKDIRWHLIGHLQSNKVKYIAEFVHMIHAVDSLKLLKEINKQAAKANSIVECLLQIHIAEEDTKFGLSEEECENLLLEPSLAEMKNIKIKGLMGMATFTDDEAQVKREFSGLKSLFDRLTQKHSGLEYWLPETLSMGMSGDHKLAVDEGSNMVRVGSSIFGARDYA